MCLTDVVSMESGLANQMVQHGSNIIKTGTELLQLIKIFGRVPNNSVLHPGVNRRWQYFKTLLFGFTRGAFIF